MDRNYSERFIISFLFATLIYTLLLHYLANLKFNLVREKSPTPAPVEVTLVEKKNHQIVDVPPVRLQAVSKHHRTYLSKKNQITPENMVSRIKGPPENKTSRIQSKVERIAPPEKKLALSRIKSLLPSPSRVNQISTQDNIIREKIGPFTLISTVSSEIARFVITQGRRVLRVLEENIENYTWFFTDIYTFKREAIVKVSFSPDGKIEKIDLIQSSGSHKVDRVLYYSVKGGLIEIAPPGGKSLKLEFILGKNYLKIVAGK